jgi:hypothetical protein
LWPGGKFPDTLLKNFILPPFLYLRRFFANGLPGNDMPVKTSFMNKNRRIFGGIFLKKQMPVN